MNCPMGCKGTINIRAKGDDKPKSMPTGGPAELVLRVKAGNLIGLTNFGIGGGSQAHLWEVWRCPQCGFAAAFYDRP